MTPQPPDLTWRPCDHERAANGYCLDCGAVVETEIVHWTPGGPEVLRSLYGPPERGDDRQ